jgi:hypothetical protein
MGQFTSKFTGKFKPLHKAHRKSKYHLCFIGDDADFRQNSGQRSKGGQN